MNNNKATGFTARNFKTYSNQDSMVLVKKTSKWRPQSREDRNRPAHMWLITF